MPLEFKSTLDDSKFQAGLRRMDKSATATVNSVVGTIQGIGKTAGEVFKGLLGGFSLGAAGYALTNAAKDALELSKSVALLTKQTGVATGQARIFQEQIKAAGASEEDMIQALGALSQELNEGGKKFQELGLDVEKLKRLGPADLFRITGKAIMSINDPLQRTRVTMGLLGEDAVKLIAAFSNPSFGTANGALAVQAQLLEANSGKFATLAKNVRETSTTIDAFKLALTAGIADGVNEGLEKVDPARAARTGDRIGAIISWGIKKAVGALDFMSKNPFTAGLMAPTGLAGPLALALNAARVATDPPKPQPGAELKPAFNNSSIFKNDAPNAEKSLNGKRSIGIFSHPDVAAKNQADEQLRRFRGMGMTDEQIADMQRPGINGGNGTLGSLSALRRFSREAGGVQDKAYKTNPEAYNRVRSRTRAEREAAGQGKKEKDKIVIDKDAAKTIAQEIVTSTKDLIPK